MTQPPDGDQPRETGGRRGGGVMKVQLPMTAHQLHDTVAIDPDVLETLANAAYVQDAEITGSRTPWELMSDARKERYRCMVLAIMSVARTKRKVKECTPRP